MIVTGRTLEHDTTHDDGDEVRAEGTRAGLLHRDRASALARALEHTGLLCTVEARAGLALLLCDEPQLVRLVSADARGAVLLLAKQHGFTHIAVEFAAHVTA